MATLWTSIPRFHGLDMHEVNDILLGVLLEGNCNDSSKKCRDARNCTNTAVGTTTCSCQHYDLVWSQCWMVKSSLIQNRFVCLFLKHCRGRPKDEMHVTEPAKEFRRAQHIILIATHIHITHTHIYTPKVFMFTHTVTNLPAVALVFPKRAGQHLNESPDSSGHFAVQLPALRLEGSSESLFWREWWAAQILDIQSCLLKPWIHGFGRLLKASVVDVLWGTGRLLDFVRNKQASGSSCIEERAADPMILNGCSADKNALQQLNFDRWKGSLVALFPQWHILMTLWGREQQL